MEDTDAGNQKRIQLVQGETPIHSEADTEDAEEEMSQQMTASYSEISARSESNTESLDLQDNFLSTESTLTKTFRPLTLEGTVHIEGNMTHFVTEDLEYKIKLSSPVTKKGADTSSVSSNSRSCTPSGLYRHLLTPQIGPVDAKLLCDLENEAQRIATSIDNLTVNLCNILHSISAITVENVEVYKNAVAKMSDAMDGNIKSMYTIMAKAEEVSEAMKIVQAHAYRIRDIKHWVDVLDSYM